MTLSKRAELMFRHSVTYPLLRMLFRNKVASGTVDVTKLRSVLLLRYDRFGDMIVTSPITRHLKAINPSLTVGIAASELNAVVAHHLPGVDRVHVVSGRIGRILSSIRQARAAKYDVVINCIFNRTSTGGILANLMSPHGLKVGQGEPKYAFYFNRQLSLEKGSSHMAALLDTYMRGVFGESWGIPDLRYAISQDPAADRRIHAYIGTMQTTSGKRRTEYIVLNTTAGEARRNPSPDQIMYVARQLVQQSPYTVVLVGAPGSESVMQTIRSQSQSERIMLYPPAGSAPFMDMVSLIGRASFLVSPDTSLVHVACAVRTPAVAFYASSREFAEWSPIGIRYEALFDDATGVVRSIPGERIMAAFAELRSRVSKGGAV